MQTPSFGQRPNIPVLVLEATHLRLLRQAAQETYPRECCGLLIGEASGRVREVQPLPNVETERPETRYVIDPFVYRDLESRVDARGLKVLGIFHSHPDYVARPSEEDRRRAWPDFVYLILAVTQGQVTDLQAWVMDASGEFRSVPVRCIDANVQAGA